MTAPPHIPSHVPVLVVGAGPAGLATAATLARHGVASLLVERRAALSGLPRATSISMRSMELLRAWGLEDEVRAGGQDVEWNCLSCETLAASADGEVVPLGLPTRAQSALVSPTAPACVPQDHLEPVLLRHVRATGAVHVALGTELGAIEVGADGVRAVLRGADGAAHVVRTEHVVAADGAHSTVRRALGIAMHGPTDLARATTALFRAPLWELLGDRRHGLYDITGADGAGTLLPAGRGDRWLYGVFHEEAEGPSAEAMAARIRSAGGVPGLRPRIERVGSFSFAAQLAERFRHGRAFLVGDAAHRVTPRGGTGMNTALHDGFDLGWKLAWTHRGWAGPGLLDRYEAERRPVAAHNAARSADPDGSRRDPEDALHADLGGRLPHVWVGGPGGRRSTLDLLGTGLTLLTGPERAPWGAAAAGLGGAPPVAVHALDAVTARALGVRGDGALLARPDGAPAGLWSQGAGAPAALRAAVAALTDAGADAAVSRAA